MRQSLPHLSPSPCSLVQPPVRISPPLPCPLPTPTPSACHDSGSPVNTITLWGVNSPNVTRVSDIRPVLTADSGHDSAHLLHFTYYVKTMPDCHDSQQTSSDLCMHMHEHACQAHSALDYSTATSQNTPRHKFAHPPDSLAIPTSLHCPLPLTSGGPFVLGCPPVPPYNGPSRREAQHLPAGAGGVCVVVRLSPPVPRIGLRRPRGSGDDPAVCKIMAGGCCDRDVHGCCAGWFYATLGLPFRCCLLLGL